MYLKPKQKHATQQEIDETIKASRITINHLKAELQAARKEIDEFAEQNYDRLFLSKLKAVIAILVLVAYIWYIWTVTK